MPLHIHKDYTDNLPLKCCLNEIVDNTTQHTGLNFLANSMISYLLDTERHFIDFCSCRLKLHLFCVFALYIFCQSDWVAIKLGVPCRRCDHCKHGQYNLCDDMKFCATSSMYCSLTQYYCHNCDFMMMSHDVIVMKVT